MSKMMATGQVNVKKEEMDEAVGYASAEQTSKYSIGTTKVRKYFEGSGWFTGKVTSHDGEHYHVLYEDGDSEEYDEDELSRIVLTPDLEKVKIGSRVAVYRSDDDQYHEAIVTRERINEKPLYLLYGNGDREWVDLRQRVFILLEETPHRQSHRRRKRDEGHADESIPEFDNDSQRRGLALKHDDSDDETDGNEAEAHASQLITPIKIEDEVKPPSETYDETDEKGAEAQASPLPSNDEVPSSDLSKIRVGSRVAVYKPDIDQYCEGIVTRERTDKKPLYMEYTNGDREWVDLGQQVFVLMEEISRRRGRRRSNEKLKDESMPTRETDARPKQRDSTRRRVSDGSSQRNKAKGSSLTNASKDEKAQIALPSDLAQIKVGSRIAVYRPDDDQYYEAVVTRERNDKRPLFLEYKNGDSGWLDLRQHMFILLEERTRRRGRRQSNDWNRGRDSDADTEKNKVEVGKYKKRRRIESDEEMESDMDDEEDDYWKKDEVTSTRAEENKLNCDASQQSSVLDTSKYAIGTKVKKLFDGHGWFVGEVTSYDGEYYHVVYGDGDTEEYNESELAAIVISSDLAKVQIGSRVAVHWPEDDKYYEATVTHERKDKKNSFRLEYDDGDQYEWLDLRQHKFCLLGGGTRRRSDTVVEDESDSGGDSGNELFSDDERTETDSDS